MGLSVDIYNKEIIQNKYIVQFVTINCIPKTRVKSPKSSFFPVSCINYVLDLMQSIPVKHFILYAPLNIQTVAL